MRIAATVFLYLNLLGSVIALTSYQLQYRKLKKRGFGYNNAEKASEFVLYSLLSIQWLFGIFFVAVLGISPFWIIAWIIAGSIFAVIAQNFAAASGLSLFITLGEMEYERRETEMDKKFGSYAQGESKLPPERSQGIFAETHTNHPAKCVGGDAYKFEALQFIRIVYCPVYVSWGYYA